MAVKENVLPEADEVNPKFTAGHTVTSNEVDTESPQLFTNNRTILKVPEEV